jgi:hypothetical protein
LQEIAARLNDLVKMDAPEAALWRRVETIVTAPSLREAASRFNRWAVTQPLRLGIYMHPDPADRPADLLLTTAAQRGAESVVWALYLNYFANPNRDRLKRCPQCDRWFVDRTRPHTMIRCSTACTNAWWTTARRRDAGHAVPGSTRKSKRRAAK